MQVGELLVAGMGAVGDANWQASVEACCAARGPHEPSRDDLATTAGLLLAAGRADRAIHLLTQVVKADPDDLATRRTLAWALCVLGKPADDARIEAAAAELQADRAFAFLQHDDRRQFYETCREHPLMALLGYDGIEPNG